VDSIPRGRVATYGQVAEEAGLPGRARLVGKTLRELEPSSELPWHRVVGAGGRLVMGSEQGSGKTQFKRLGREGILFNASRRIDLERFGWRP
jgi:methylated-DNA-protein-cysteine methyltransferase-like protein